MGSSGGSRKTGNVSRETFHSFGVVFHRALSKYLRGWGLVEGEVGTEGT
jgi:hypothetical protein